MDSETQFFCLQVIENFVKTRYLASSTEHQNILKNFLFRWTGMQVNDETFNMTDQIESSISN